MLMALLASSRKLARLPHRNHRDHEVIVEEIVPSLLHCNSRTLVIIRENIHLGQWFSEGESKKNPVGVSLVCDLNNSNKDQVYVILESMWPPSMKHDRPSIFYFALLAFSFFFRNGDGMGLDGLSSSN